MTPEQRQAARERCDKATAGPWCVDATRSLGAYGVWTDYETHPGHDGAGYPSQICSFHITGSASQSVECRNNLAAFIAAARTDLPDALDYIEKLEAEITDLKAQIEFQETISLEKSE